MTTKEINDHSNARLMSKLGFGCAIPCAIFLVLMALYFVTGVLFGREPWPNGGWWFWVLIWVTGIWVSLSAVAHYEKSYPPFSVEPLPALEVTRDVSGFPVITWPVVETEKSGPLDAYTLEELYSVRSAQIDPRSFILTVTSSPKFRRFIDVVRAADTNFERNAPPLNTETIIISQFPVDDLIGFELKNSSDFELTGVDLQNQSAGRLNYIGHFLVRAELRDRTIFTVSRSSSNREYAEAVLAALTREFIINRPPEGWKKRGDAKSGAARSPGSTPRSDHDPI